MARYSRNLLRNSNTLNILQKHIVLFIVFLALLVGGCGSDEADPDESDDTENTAGNPSVGNAGVSGKDETESDPVSGVDPTNPCSDPTVYTLDDVESLKECTAISGDLEISDEATEVTNLSGLTNLQTVEGNLSVLAPNLDSVQGLSNLTTVTGKLTIMAPRLTTLEGLNNLVSVGGLYLNNCEALADLNGLGSLTSVDGNLSIYNKDDKTNDVLTSLEGLSSLTSVGGTLLILNIRSVPACEVDALCDKLSADENKKETATICGTAKDECGGGEDFCDIQT